MLKPSRYNFFYDIEDGKALAFNSATGAMAEVDRESYPRIKNLLADCRLADSLEYRDLRKSLLEGGFLVEESVDEISALEKESLRERCNDKSFILTIAPTLACNFACDYCFESLSPVRMNEQTERALLEFVDNHLKSAEDIAVVWFGGEPTLCLQIIERLQIGFNDLAYKYNIEMKPSSIITNGYLLDADMARRLKKIGINSAQVTLDGNEKTHDSRRMLKNGRGTFRKIVDNLKETADIIDILVRVNVDRANAGNALAVAEELQKWGIINKIGIYFAQVTSSGTACASISSRCFSGEQFSQELVGLYKKLIDMGIYRVEYPVISAAGHCGAVTENSILVSPTGDLFRCWEELSLDSSTSVGNIFNQHMNQEQNETREKYQRWDPFKMSECRECDILPICMGGCPFHGMNSEIVGKGVCSSYKHNLEDMLKLRYLCDIRKEVSK